MILGADERHGCRWMRVNDFAETVLVPKLSARWMGWAR